jgi:hypothetical protein
VNLGSDTILLIERISGGKMQQTWVSYGALSMMQQIGAVPQQTEGVIPTAATLVVKDETEESTSWKRSNV